MSNIHPSWKIKDERVQELSHIANMLTFPREYFEERIQKIAFMGKSTYLLDAACGAGIWAIAASYRNREVRAIDSTEKYLTVGKVIQRELKIAFRHANLKFKIGKLEHLPYPDKYFDFVLCYNAWMYTRREQSLKEMWRVLKPGGRIYLGSIAGLGYYLDLALQGLIKGNRGLAITALRAIKDRVYMTEKESRDLLEKQGFKILGFGSDGEVGNDKIKIKPIFPAKFLGFWHTYEILGEKTLM